MRAEEPRETRRADGAAAATPEAAGRAWRGARCGKRQASSGVLREGRGGRAGEGVWDLVRQLDGTGSRASVWGAVWSADSEADLLRPDEESVVRSAVKVAAAIHRPVVVPLRRIELHPHPRAFLEIRLAEKADGAVRRGDGGGGASQPESGGRRGERKVTLGSVGLRRPHDCPHVAVGRTSPRTATTRVWRPRG